MFKSRKNKSFTYTTRFSEAKKVNANQEETSKYSDFSSKWRNHQGLGSKKQKKGRSLLVLVFVLILLLISMYILDVKFR